MMMTSEENLSEIKKETFISSKMKYKFIDGKLSAQDANQGETSSFSTFFSHEL